MTTSGMNLADLPPLNALPQGIASPAKRIVRKTSSEEILGIQTSSISLAQPWPEVTMLMMMGLVLRR